MRELFLDYFAYDAKSGKLLWKIKRGVWRPDHEAGCLHKHKGCRVVQLLGKQYKVHRVIWCMVYGEPVPEIIDHIDRDPTNNRLENLRAATSSLNNLNTDQGVTFRRGRWRVRFQDIEETYADEDEARQRRNQLLKEHGVIEC